MVTDTTTSGISATSTDTSSISSLFQSEFLGNMTSFSIVDVLMALVVSFLMGLMIFAVYRKCYNGVMYSSGFALSLIAMNMVTALVILAISTNVVLSLGMVGALSIVRFRTAVKDPMDIAYLFWAIAEGIIIGAGMIPLGVLGGLVVAVILIAFSSKKPKDKPYILVLNCENDAAEKAAVKKVEAGVKKSQVKSKTVSANGIELTMEVNLIENETGFVNGVAEVSGITNAVLVSYNGEFMS